MNLAIAPLERLSPVALSGAGALNRATGRSQIAADNDLAAIQTWLQQYEGNAHTHRASRKEAERLLLWSVCEARKPISAMTVEDCMAYRAFLADPQPVERWIGPRRERFSPDWRPFSGPLSLASRRQAEVVVAGLFRWLHAVGYLAGNPWLAVGARLPRPERRVSRFLPAVVWQAAMAWCENAVVGSPGSKSIRKRFILMAFYLSRARISELAHARMSDIVAVERPSGVQWWLRIEGKGSKVRRVPIPGLMEALRTYRASRGLPVLPAGEDLPLIARLHRPTLAISPNGLHREIKRIFAEIAAWCDDPAIADQIRQASAHWLRHSAASHALDAGESLASVQSSLGHASLDTTSIYVHADEDRQYAEFERIGGTLAHGVFTGASTNNSC